MAIITIVVIWNISNIVKKGGDIFYTFKIKDKKQVIIIK